MIKEDRTKGYTFNTKHLPLEETEELLEGQLQCVHFTISDADKLEKIIDRINQWYAESDEIILAEHGITFKGLGFVIMEWNGYEIDPPFLEVLQNTKIIDDFSIYIRYEGI